MDRLTERQYGAYCSHANTPDCDDCNTCKWNLAIINKLAHYEDLEEQGRLVELPCKPDELVYAVHEDFRMVKVAYASVEHILADLEAGWCIGYTPEEAEAKLAEKGGVV